MLLPDRRAWMLQTLSALGILSAGVPVLAGQHAHGSDRRDQLASPDWKPATLSLQEDRTLIALAEAIVPGSSAAACNRMIDLLLAEENDPARKKFRDALAAFDREAHTLAQTTFDKCTAEQQAGLLREASDRTSGLAPAFLIVKSWVADVYWSSQQGMRELGYKGRMAWTVFPGCEHGGAHS